MLIEAWQISFNEPGVHDGGSLRLRYIAECSRCDYVWTGGELRVKKGKQVTKINQILASCNSRKLVLVSTTPQIEPHAVDIEFLTLVNIKTWLRINTAEKGRNNSQVWTRLSKVDEAGRAP